MKKLNKNKVIRSLLLVVTCVAALTAGTTAYFSDVETSSDNVLQAGAIDLKIDNTSYYNGEVSDTTTWALADLNDSQGPSGDGRYLFLNFNDLKPGDWGEDTISLHVNNNPYWSCVDVDLTMNDDYSSVEPEISEGDVPNNPDDFFDGELAQEVNFVFWADDGDNVLEVSEKEKIISQGTAEEVLGGNTWSLSDSNGNAWTGNLDDPLLGDDTQTQSYYIGKAWCFGTLSLDPVDDGNGSPLDPELDGITCSGAGASNMSQTDILKADFSFRAVQYRHNGSFICEFCDDIHEGYVSGVMEVNQGLKKDGTPVDGSRSDPTAAYAVGGPFYSLGMGGDVTYSFAGDIFGSEISVIEVTFGRDSYPRESADVYVSSDMVGWVYVGEVTNHDDSGVSKVNVSGYSGIRYVKLVDTTNPDDHTSGADGFDLDAVSAEICWDDIVDEPQVASRLIEN